MTATPELQPALKAESLRERQGEAASWLQSEGTDSHVRGAAKHRTGQPPPLRLPAARAAGPGRCEAGAARSPGPAVRPLLPLKRGRFGEWEQNQGTARSLQSLCWGHLPHSWVSGAEPTSAFPAASGLSPPWAPGHQGHLRPHQAQVLAAPTALRPAGPHLAPAPGPTQLCFIFLFLKNKNISL